MLRRFVQRHPALTYFAITFTSSWGGILLVVGPTNIFATKQVFESYVWVPPLVLGPTVAGLSTTWLAGGRSGLRDFGRRLARWRVAPRWYAIALLTAPIYTTVAALLLSLYSPDLLPPFIHADNKGTLLAQGAIIGLSAGIFEELGWTGFATPALRRRHAPLGTALIIGLVWGAWHILPEALGARGFALLPYLPIHLVAVIVGLTGYRILMVRVYERTESTLIGILMHTALTAGLFLFQPVAIGGELLVVGIVLDIIPWLIVGALALVDLQRRPRTNPAHRLPHPPHATWARIQR